MIKREAINLLNNLSEEIKISKYFKKEKTICRNIDKIKDGIKNGFDS